MKKFFSTICIVCLLVLSLAGCSLIETNMAKYLAQPVAKAGGVTVTMEELIEGLNSFGYEQYANTEKNPTGNTQKQVVEKTIDDLLDKEFVLQYIEADPNFTLTTYEKNKAKKVAYDYINSSLKSYEEEIRVEEEMVPPSKDAEEEDAEAKKTIYTPYAKKVVKKDGSSDLEYVNNEIKNESENDDYEEIMALGEFKFDSAGADDSVNASDDEKKVFKEAKSRLYRLLRKNNKDRGGKEKTDDVLVKDEIERAYIKNIENAKIKKLGSNYQDKMQKDEVDSNGDLIPNSSLDTLKKDVSKAFINAYNKEKNNYITGTDGKIPTAKLEEYYTKVKDGKEQVLYHPEEKQFFYVSHILLGFSETQKTELEDYKKLVTSGKYTNEDLKAFKADQATHISGQVRNKTTGKFEGEPVSREAVLSEAKQSVSGQSPAEIKAYNFMQVMHKYSTDPGSLNSMQNYAIPVDGTKIKDQMVPEFAEASRELRKKALETKTDFLISEPVLSEHGYHIIVYIGEVENKFSTTVDEDDADSIINMLYDKQIKIGHDKTYFDHFVESAQTIDQNRYIESITSTKRDGLKIKLYTDSYKKLIKD